MNLPATLFVRQQRDVGDMDCKDFDPTPRRLFSGRCETDGHYRCIECRELDMESDYALQRGAAQTPGGRDGK